MKRRPGIARDQRDDRREVARTKLPDVKICGPVSGGLDDFPHLPPYFFHLWCHIE
jgi:hypothetical protein